MKLINTLSILFILFIASACSSETDSIMNDIDNSNKNEAPGVAEAVAAFNISLTGQSLQTRGDGASTEDADTKEAAISNCFIAAISEDGKVLSSFTKNGTNNINDIKMLVKFSASYQPKLRFVAIANCEKEFNLLLACKDINSINNVVLAEDPNTTLVKVGTQELKASDYTVDGNGNGSFNDVRIDVKQRAAAIELSKLTVDGEENITVKSLTLSNIKKEGKVTGEMEGVAAKSVTKEGKVRLYTYENTSEAKTELTITYTKDNVDYSRTYTIKTNGEDKVVAGKLYKLTVSITGAAGDAQFTIADWEPNMIDMGTINGSAE